MIAKIRVFVHTLQRGVFEPWALLGACYLRAMHAAGYNIRAVPLEITDFRDETSAYANLLDLFATPIANVPEVNMIIGYGGDFEYAYTDEARNVAITTYVGRAPTPAECQQLKRFQVVGGVYRSDAATLVALDVPAIWLPPQPTNLKEVFSED